MIAAHPSPCAARRAPPARSKAIFDLHSTSPESFTGLERTKLQIRLDRARTRRVLFQEGASPALLSVHALSDDDGEKSSDGGGEATSDEQEPELEPNSEPRSHEADTTRVVAQSWATVSSCPPLQPSPSSTDDDATVVPSSLALRAPPPPSETETRAGARLPVVVAPVHLANIDAVPFKRTQGFSLPLGPSSPVRRALPTRSQSLPVASAVVRVPIAASHEVWPSPQPLCTSGLAALLARPTPVPLPAPHARPLEAACGMTRPVAWNEVALSRAFNLLKKRAAAIVPVPPPNTPTSSPVVVPKKTTFSYGSLRKKQAETTLVSEFFAEPLRSPPARRRNTSASLPVPKVSSPTTLRATSASSDSPRHFGAVAFVSLESGHVVVPEQTSTLPASSIRRRPTGTTSPNEKESFPVDIVASSSDLASSTDATSDNPSPASLRTASTPETSPATSTDTPTSQASSRPSFARRSSAPYSPSGKTCPSTAVFSRNSLYLDRLFVQPPTLLPSPSPSPAGAPLIRTVSAPDVSLYPRPRLFEPVPTYSSAADLPRSQMPFAFPYVSPSYSRVLFHPKSPRPINSNTVAVGLGPAAKPKKKKSKRAGYEADAERDAAVLEYYPFEESVFASPHSNSATSLSSYALDDSAHRASSSMFRARTPAGPHPSMLDSSPPSGPGDSPLQSHTTPSPFLTSAVPASTDQCTVVSPPCELVASIEKRSLTSQQSRRLSLRQEQQARKAAATGDLEEIAVTPVDVPKEVARRKRFFLL